MNERLAHGRALISGHLGGARAAPEVESLIVALAADISRPARFNPEAWPNGLAEALAAVDSLAERNATQGATIVRLEGLKRTAQSEAERAKAAKREAESRLEVASLTAELATAEAAELRDVLEGLAACLAGLPLAVLASAGEAGRLAALYLRAEVLTAEEPAERRERLERRLAGDPQRESS